MIVNPYAPYQNLDEDELPEEEAEEVQVNPADNRMQAFKEAHKKLKKAGFYDQLVNNAIFSGTEEGDEVNREIQQWAEAQMFQLLNVNSPQPQTGNLMGFLPQEASILKRLASMSPDQVEALLSLTTTVSTLASTAPAPRKLPNPSGMGGPPQSPPPQSGGGFTPPTAPAQPQPRKTRAPKRPKAGEYERTNQGKTIKLQKPPPGAVPFPVGQDFERESYMAATAVRQGGVVGATTEATQGVPTADSNLISGMIMGALNKPE